MRSLIYFVDLYQRSLSSVYFVQAKGYHTKKHDFRTCPHCLEQVEDIKVSSNNSRCEKCGKTVCEFGLYEKDNEQYLLKKDLYSTRGSKIILLCFSLIFLVPLFFQYSLDVPKDFAEPYRNMILLLLVMYIGLVFGGLVFLEGESVTFGIVSAKRESWVFTFLFFVLIVGMSFSFLLFHVPRWISIPL